MRSNYLSQPGEHLELPYDPTTYDPYGSEVAARARRRPSGANDLPRHGDKSRARVALWSCASEVVELHPAAGAGES